MILLCEGENPLRRYLLRKYAATPCAGLCPATPRIRYNSDLSYNMFGRMRSAHSPNEPRVLANANSEAGVCVSAYADNTATNK